MLRQRVFIPGKTFNAGGGIHRAGNTSNKPAGNARSIATVIGEKFGRYWVVTM